MKFMGNLTLILSMLCLVLTMAVKWALGGWMPFMSMALFFAGFFLLISVALNYKTYLAFFKSDGLHYAFKSFGYVSLFLVFLVALNYVVSRNNKVFDFTENKTNSLSEFTETVVGSLDKDFYFYFFHTDSAENKNQEAMVRGVLEKYTQLSSRIHVRSYSVYQFPDMARDFKVAEQEAALFAVLGEKRQRLTAIDESTLTNSILRLSKDVKRIYFLQGQGERKLSDEGSFGLSRLRAELERIYYEVLPLETFEIPEDAAFVAIVGPRLSFSNEQIDRLRNYLKKGGALLLALDPGESHNLALLTKSFGIEFQNTFVFADKTSVALDQTQLTVFGEPGMDRHPLTEVIGQQQRPVFFMASPLKVRSRDVEGAIITSLVQTSKKAVAKTDMNIQSATAGEGPLSLAAIAEAKDKETNYFRLFVVGDSDFLTNQFFKQHANFNFFVNLAGYLTRDPEMINMRPRAPKTTYMLMSQVQTNFYGIFFILPFPLLYFIIAIFLRIRRAI